MEFEDEQAEDTPAPLTDLEKKLMQQAAAAEMLDNYTRDFQRLQRQKSKRHNGVEARILRSKAFRWGEQWLQQIDSGLGTAPEDENKLHLVFNVIDKAADKLAGRLTAIGGQFYTRPDKKDPKALSEAEVCDKLLLALDEKLDQPARMWEIVDNLLTDGVAFEYVPWVPDAMTEPVPQFGENNEILFKYTPTGEVVTEAQKDELITTQNLPPEQFEIYEEVELVGDVGSEVFGGLSVFVDQSVKSIQDLAPDQAVYIAKIRTEGWIEENYPGKLEGIELGGELQIVTTNIFKDQNTNNNSFLKDLIPMFQGEVAEDDPKMAVVVERYQPSSKKNPRGKFSCFIPGKVILFDGENPYEEVPLVDFHLKPVTTTFWTKDFITDLIAPQKFINKRFSQMGEQANASIYDKILTGGTIAAKDIAPDKPGVIEKAITENGLPMVQRLPGPQLPSWFLQSLDTSIKMFSQIAGGADLFEESQFPGQMRGPMAVPLLQELLDSQWGPVFQHIGQRLARVKQMRLNRVKQFYPPIRTLHYTDQSQQDEVMVFHTDEILKGGTNFNVTVERSSLIPEFRALREQRLVERLNSPLGILYTDNRTGQLDKSKIAADLQLGDFGREGREAQARKFANQLIEKLWKGEPIPPVMQFWDHEPMLDELEGAMMTTEFLSKSPQVQQMFIDRWQQHANFLQQRAMMQQQAMMSQQVHQAVAQATQQAAAMAASDTVNQTQQQIQMQQQTNAPDQPGGPSQIQKLVEARAGGLKR